VEHRLERATLGDFEQRSYWIEIKEKRFVAIEAAGAIWRICVCGAMAPGWWKPRRNWPKPS
jgi:hypothetical protein